MTCHMTELQHSTIMDFLTYLTECVEYPDQRPGHGSAILVYLTQYVHRRVRQILHVCERVKTDTLPPLPPPVLLWS